MDFAKVLICIPAGRGVVGAHMAAFLNQMGKKGVDAILVSEVYPRDFARNKMVKHFLEGTWEWMWWLDADMRPVEGSANLLNWLESGQGEVYTGYTNAIQVKPGEVKIFIPTMACEKDGAWLTVSGAQQEACYVEGVGFGSTIIHRSVLEDPRVWAQEDAIFRDATGPGGEVMETEDLVFSRKARAAGYRLVYIPTAPIGHEKMLDVCDVNFWINTERQKRGE